MKHPRFFVALVAGCTVLALGACEDDMTGYDQVDQSAFAKGPGGGGGGGGSPDVQGLYSDLVYLYRDVYGRPILKTFNVLLEDEPSTETCVQPVSYVPIVDTWGDVTAAIEPIVNPVNGKEVWLIPLAGEFMPEATVSITAAGEPGVPGGGEEEETTELGPCDPYGEFNADGTVAFTYGVYALEVPFGRLNMGRAPQRTVDRAYAEVELKLTSMVDGLYLDHGGRWAPDGVAIDAPAENLVIHRELQIRGAFGTWESPTPIGAEGWYDFLDHAASTLAGASDKFGRINEDLIVYNNAILGFPDNTAAGGLPVLEGDGTNGFEGVKYLNYTGFHYSRAQTFPGCVQIGYFDENEQVQSAKGTIMDLAFGGVQVTGDDLHGFAMRADDARELILFEHDYWINDIDRIGESTKCGEWGVPLWTE